MTANAARKRWLYVFIGMFIYMCMGTVYSWSIFRTPLEQRLSIDSTTSGTPYLVFLLFFTLSMILMGRFIDRYKPRIIIFAGGILLGLGWILSALTSSFALIILFYGVVGGSGVGIIYGAPIKFISSLFADKRGMAIGLLVGGFGLSPFITAPISKALINSIGISGTFLAIGLFFLFVIPLLGWSFNNSDPYVRPIASEKSEGNDKLINILKSRKFIGLWLCFLIASSIGLMIIGVSSQIGVEVYGINADTTAFLLSVFAIFNAIGRPGFGWITDKFKPLKAALISFSLILIAGLLLKLQINTPVLLFTISISLLWLNLGAWLSIAPASTAMFFGESNYSRNYGIVFSAYGLGALLGTPFAEFIKSRFGSYSHLSTPIMIAASIGILIALLTMPLKNK